MYFNNMNNDMGGGAGSTKPSEEPPKLSLFDNHLDSASGEMHALKKHALGTTRTSLSATIVAELCRKVIHACEVDPQNPHEAVAEIIKKELDDGASKVNKDVSSILSELGLDCPIPMEEMRKNVLEQRLRNLYHHPIMSVFLTSKHPSYLMAKEMYPILVGLADFDQDAKVEVTIETLKALSNVHG